MKTRQEIIEFFVCSPEMADRILAVQDRGTAHGAAGYYPDGDYSSDADWCYGVGAEISAIEEALDVDDASVFDVYMEAHTAALPPRCESCETQFLPVEGRDGTWSPACDCNDCCDEDSDWTVTP